MAQDRIPDPVQVNAPSYYSSLMSTMALRREGNVGAATQTPYGLSYGDSGSKLYYSSTNDNLIYQSTLDTAWDITSVNVPTSQAFDSNAAGVKGFTFSDDGTKLATAGPVTDVNEYSLDTAWDITTATFQRAHDVPLRTWYPGDVDFGDGGSKLYVCGYVNGTSGIVQLDLATEYSLETVDSQQAHDTTGRPALNPSGVVITPGGYRVFITDVNGDSIQELALQTQWDITTATRERAYDASQESSAWGGTAFGHNGDSIITVDQDNTRILEYSTLS